MGIGLGGRKERSEGGVETIPTDKIGPKPMFVGEGGREGSPRPMV